MKEDISKCVHLKELDFSFNNITDSVTTQIVMLALHMKALILLNLSHNFISDIGAYRIGQSIKLFSKKRSTALKMDLCTLIMKLSTLLVKIAY